ncbi:MAG: VOC family protein, partial [Pseudomonadota bacterium]
MSSISHITLGTNDIDRAAVFYDAVLGALGFDRLPKPPSYPLAYQKGEWPTIFIYTPFNDLPATWGNGTHVAFVADSQEAVHAFHEAALKTG